MNWRETLTSLKDLIKDCYNEEPLIAMFIALTIWLGIFMLLLSSSMEDSLPDDLSTKHRLESTKHRLEIELITAKSDARVTKEILMAENHFLLRTLKDREHQLDECRGSSQP